MGCVTPPTACLSSPRTSHSAYQPYPIWLCLSSYKVRHEVLIVTTSNTQKHPYKEVIEGKLKQEHYELSLRVTPFCVYFGLIIGLTRLLLLCPTPSLHDFVCFGHLTRSRERGKLDHGVLQCYKRAPSRPGSKGEHTARMHSTILEGYWCAAVSWLGLGLTDCTASGSCRSDVVR